MKSTKLVAQICKEAMNLHITSYCQKKFDYKLPLERACEKAAKDHGEPLLGRLVYLVLDSWWNDVQVWVEEVEKSKNKN